MRDDGRGRCDDEGGDGRRVSREQRDGPSESFIKGFRRDRYGCVNEAEAAGMSAPVRAVVHAMEPRPLLRAEEERLLLRRVHVAPPAARVPPKRFAIHSCMSKVWVAVDTGERLEPDNVRRGIYHDGEDAIEDLDAFPRSRLTQLGEVVGLLRRLVAQRHGRFVWCQRENLLPAPAPQRRETAVSVGPRVGAPRFWSSVGFGQQASGPRGGWFERF